MQDHTREHEEKPRQPTTAKLLADDGRKPKNGKKTGADVQPFGQRRAPQNQSLAPKPVPETFHTPNPHETPAPQNDLAPKNEPPLQIDETPDPTKKEPRVVNSEPAARKDGADLVNQPGGGKKNPAHKDPSLGFGRPGFSRLIRSAMGSDFPHRFQIQKAFGRFDIGAARAVRGSSAEKLTAATSSSAFASGHVAAFRGEPSLHTAAHEAAHIVQQSSKHHPSIQRKASEQLKTEASGEAASLEVHADRVADAVVRGESAESILAEVAQPGSIQDRTAQLSKGIIQFQQRPSVNQTRQPDPRTDPRYIAAERRWRMLGIQAGRQAIADAQKKTADRSIVERLALIAVIRAIRTPMQRYADTPGTIHAGCKVTGPLLVGILRAVGIQAETKLSERLGHTFVLMTRSRQGLGHIDDLFNRDLRTIPDEDLVRSERELLCHFHSEAGLPKRKGDELVRQDETNPAKMAEMQHAKEQIARAMGAEQLAIRSREIDPGTKQTRIGSVSIAEVVRHTNLRPSGLYRRHWDERLHRPKNLADLRKTIASYANAAHSSTRPSSFMPATLGESVAFLARKSNDYILYEIVGSDLANRDGDFSRHTKDFYRRRSCP